MPGCVSVGDREVQGAWKFAEQNEASKAGGLEDQRSLVPPIKNRKFVIRIGASCLKSSTPKAKAIRLFSSRLV